MSALVLYTIFIFFVYVQIISTKSYFVTINSACTRVNVAKRLMSFYNGLNFYHFPHFIMNQKSPLCTLVCVLLVIGALNWVLQGLGFLVSGANWNVVNLLLAKWQTAEAVVYVIIGLAGLYKLIVWGKCCGSSCSAPGQPSA